VSKNPARIKTKQIFQHAPVIMTDACKKHKINNKKKKKKNAHTYYVMKHVPKPCKNQKK
jgi:hypothetical protein